MESAKSFERATCPGESALYDERALMRESAAILKRAKVSECAKH
jgi:hypothetical protein